ncbi:type VI secretion system contractile sheath small subunit [Polyangium jinanense]|uniref:Type VI secretion system contractile sheath small subunit n=1 Tax=Polyangium jinanense TaxID=2829994 RepID=A0A9X3WXG3_9BACT|nr:type VI secretion system contractile sheath small subunit [Polyangium jinanense]MDC3953864.1 type VI secretion system contractile sheath small subunit [Polyangium jinanense]MDC3979015.1 type VI secretion system contractile sheath small subunit [Polyangium jinanense]
MSKYIQDQIFKSRLTITYRTNITGTPQQEKLPYRILVLGEFEGRSKRAAGLLPALSERNIRSIKRGTTVDDHLHEIVPTWHLPKALSHLKSSLPGTVTLDRIVCTVPSGAIARKEAGKYPLTGKAHFQSTPEENGLSRVDGEIVVGGTLDVKSIDDAGNLEVQGATITFSGEVAGDTIDPSTRKKVGLVTGLLRNRVVALEAANVPKPEAQDSDDDDVSKGRVYVLPITTPLKVSAERTVPFASMKDFSPDAVASSIPELQRLRVIKLMMLELQSMLRNRPELRAQMKRALASPDGLKELQKWAKDNYKVLEI